MAGRILASARIELVRKKKLCADLFVGEIRVNMATKRSRGDFEAGPQASLSSCVAYGTPLPPLEPEIRDDGSYVPIWKQEVRDERGRKRLHGAFTGGFSAG